MVTVLLEKTITSLNSRIRISMISLAFAILVGFSALIKIPIPGTPIPATLQTFAILAGAGILKRYAAIQMIAWYLILGLVGAPFFAGGSGLTHLMGASGGYLFGFLLASIVVGFFDRQSNSVISRIMIYLLASLIIYPSGLIHLKYVTHANWSDVITMGLVPFIIFDFIKALAACICVRSIKRGSQD